jgi:hypothetical protein
VPPHTGADRRALSVDDPQYDARNNVLGTINLLEASRPGGEYPRVLGVLIEAAHENRR